MNFLTLLLLLTGLISTSVGAREGFYEPRNLKRDQPLLEKARGATVLFDFQNEWGEFVPVANGFFISNDGSILTNHHVGNLCGGRNASAQYEDHSHPLEYPAGRGYLCENFRARVFPNTRFELALRLELIARPDNALLAQGGDFMVLRALNYKPEAYVGLANTFDFPLGTPYFMVGYPPETHRGESSELIRRGIYSDVRFRGEYRVALGTIVPKPSDYLHADNPVPYFVGNGDGAPGTSGSLIINEKGNFLGLVQGYADRRGIPGNSFCLRDGQPTGAADYYCGGLLNYIRARWVIDRMEERFPRTLDALLKR